jgi:hypothetical protein
MLHAGVPLLLDAGWRCIARIAAIPLASGRLDRRGLNHLAAALPRMLVHDTANRISTC